MRSAFLVFLAACVMAQGCTTVKVSREPAEGGAATLALQATRGDDLKRGYDFKVTRDGVQVARAISATDRPVVLEKLAPGKYEVRIKGSRIRREHVEVRLSPGERATVSLLVGAARRRAVMAGIGEAIGKAILYTVAVIVYLIAVVADFCDSDEDDECDRCHDDPCTCRH